MLKTTTLLALALIGVAGLAQAQPAGTREEMPQMLAVAPDDCVRHRVAISDEYGFRYDVRGDRINARGCVVAPPHTKLGARVIQD